jgi:hypothetical protein
MKIDCVSKCVAVAVGLTLAAFLGHNGYKMVVEFHDEMADWYARAYSEHEPFKHLYELRRQRELEGPSEEITEAILAQHKKIAALYDMPMNKGGYVNSPSLSFHYDVTLRSLNSPRRELRRACKELVGVTLAAALVGFVGGYVGTRTLYLTSRLLPIPFRHTDATTTDSGSSTSSAAKRKWSKALVFNLSVLAGLLVAVMDFCRIMPRFYHNFCENTLTFLQETLGPSMWPAESFILLIFIFLTGFLPVFIIGAIFIALAARSRQQEGKSGEGAA